MISRLEKDKEIKDNINKDFGNQFRLKRNR